MAETRPFTPEALAERQGDAALAAAIEFLRWRRDQIDNAIATIEAAKRLSAAFVSHAADET